MRNRFSLLASAIALVLAVTLVGPSAGAAQTGEEIAPVITINRGACAQLEERPEYELGAMQLVEIWGDPDGEEGIAETVLDEDQIGDVDAPDADAPDVDAPGVDVVGEDGVYDENDEGFLAEDFDDDGVVEIGRDLNEDGTLSEDEFLGDDINGDGALDEDEILMVAEQDQPEGGVVWKADTTFEGADGQELVADRNFSMVVHQSEERFEIILACGEILDLVEEDQVIVLLRPVEGSQYTGVAMIEKDSAEYAAFLLEGPTVPAPPTPSPPPPTNTPAPTDTPMPTETPVPTDTPVPPTNTPVEVTEVVEEVVTEVVTEVVEVEATQTPTPAS